MEAVALYPSVMVVLVMCGKAVNLHWFMFGIVAISAQIYVGVRQVLQNVKFSLEGC